MASKAGNSRAESVATPKRDALTIDPANPRIARALLALTLRALLVGSLLIAVGAFAGPRKQASSKAARAGAHLKAGRSSPARAPRPPVVNSYRWVIDLADALTPDAGKNVVGTATDASTRATPGLGKIDARGGPAGPVLSSNPDHNRGTRYYRTGIPSDDLFWPGPLNRTRVVRSFSKLRSKLAACAGLATNRTGREFNAVSVRMLIRGDGVILHSSESSEHQDLADAATCVHDKLLAWRFPGCKGCFSTTSRMRVELCSPLAPEPGATAPASAGPDLVQRCAAEQARQRAAEELAARQRAAEELAARPRVPPTLRVDDSGAIHVRRQGLGDELGSLVRFFAHSRPEVQPTVEGRYTFRITSPPPVLLRVGFRDGDVVASVNGVDVLGRSDIAKIGASFESAEQVDVRVQRLGSSVHLRYVFE